MGDQINNLSVPLYRILVKVGASERRRELHQRTSTAEEILATVYFSLRHEEQHIRYYCGSSSEGSVTSDMVSDVDVVHCLAFSPVVLDVDAAPPGVSFLMVRDSWTPPGYCKLQVVENGQLMYDRHFLYPDVAGIDYKGRLCRKHYQGKNMHGPADMRVDQNGFHYLDFVAAYKCDRVPSCDIQWIMRRRPYNWPSPEQLQKMSRLGCMVVGVGKSSEHELEWRISYSLQERMLMKNLNPTQHKVYILLKIIKKNIFRDMFHEETLSSYHFKTCILYAIQMTPAHMWTPFNLINCLLQCLKLMERWVKYGYCPSFLIQDQNLLAKVGFVRIRRHLLTVMRFIFRGGRQFLYMLHSDNIGTLLRGMDCRMHREIRVKNKVKYIFEIKEKHIRSVNSSLFSLIHNICGGHFGPLDLAYILYTLKQECQISGHTVEETRSALEYLFPWLHLHIANGLASAALTCPDAATKGRLERATDFHLHEARGADLVNPRLARATAMYASGRYQECYMLLQLIENDFILQMKVFCPCTRTQASLCYDLHDLNVRIRKLAKLPVQQIMASHTASCVIFMPSAAAIVPEPLLYEMKRSMDTPPYSRNEKDDFWFDWVAVNARSYLYFLQYLVSNKLQRNVYRQVARDNLCAEIFTDDRSEMRGETPTLGHKETSYNLLGWIYMQEGRFAEALMCFETSLRIRPLHNAAKHHVRDLIAMTS